MTNGEVAASVAPRGAVRCWSRAVDEWYGRGELLRQGAWTELATALVMIPMGACLFAWPAASDTVHTISLITHPSATRGWAIPGWTIGLWFLAAGLLMLAGLALYFVRGRCFWSKVCRHAGASMAMVGWLFLLFSDLGVVGWKNAGIYLYLLPVLLMLRAVSLAWRRFG